MQVYSQEILRIASGFTKETFANYNTDDEVKGKIQNKKDYIDEPQDSSCELPEK